MSALALEDAFSDAGSDQELSDEAKQPGALVEFYMLHTPSKSLICDCADFVIYVLYLFLLLLPDPLAPQKKHFLRSTSSKTKDFLAAKKSWW